MSVSVCECECVRECVFVIGLITDWMLRSSCLRVIPTLTDRLRQAVDEAAQKM